VPGGHFFFKKIKKRVDKKPNRCHPCAVKIKSKQEANMKLKQTTEGTKKQPVPPLPILRWNWHDESVSKAVDEYGNIFNELRCDEKTFYSVCLSEKTYGIGFGAYSDQSIEDAWEQAHEERFKKFDLEWQSFSSKLREIVAKYNMIDKKQVEVNIQIKKKEAA